MNKLLLTTCFLGMGLALSGCINPLPSKVGAQVSDPEALALLAASAEAHGGDEAFARVRQIDVSYDGEWLNNVWKLQPMLVDRGFRKSSEETIAYSYNVWPIVTQTHTGPDGTKTVRWPAEHPEADTLAGGAAVRYNGELIDDAAERVRQEEASAMVAEAYRMFLTGPFYFTQRSEDMTAVMSEPTTVLGAECDQILVELRPGFGVSEVDRVQIAIDRETKYVRRVRFSLDGFRKTAGATADVEMSGYTDVDGIVFPTQFLEIVTHPINREVHRWEALSIKTYE